MTAKMLESQAVINKEITAIRKRLNTGKTSYITKANAVKLKSELPKLLKETNNALMNSVLHNDGFMAAELNTLKHEVLSRLAKCDSVLSASSKLHFVSIGIEDHLADYVNILNGGELDWSVIIDDNKLTNVCQLKYRNVEDKTGFTHPFYSLVFKDKDIVTSTFSPWHVQPMWIHGKTAVEKLLLQDGIQ